MRRVGREGRAMVKSFSYPKNKDELIEKLEEIARRENLTFSDIILEGLENYWKEHGESQNPQTKISLFDNRIALAIPHLYEENKDIWMKFYSQLKPQQYKELTLAIDRLLEFHVAHKILF